MRENENFSTSGGESFKITEEKTVKSDFILNIDENKDGFILNKDEKKKFSLSTSQALGFIKKANSFLVAHSKVPIEAKANFFHLLGVMIAAGVPMVSALKSLAEQSDKSVKLQIIISELCTRIEAGEKLSESLLHYPEVFEEQEIGMIQAGELSGQLNHVLENVADDEEKAYEIKSKVKSAMTYPVIVFLLLIAVVSIMMMFVVPKLAALFSSTKQTLPMLTVVVMNISNFMVNQKIAMLAIILGFTIFMLLFRRTDIGREAIDSFKINVPIFGKMFRMAYLARFSRSISNLLNSQLTILKTLEITANSIGNDIYKKKLLIAAEDVKQGLPLAESLTDSDLFNPMIINMIDIGEKTAQLDVIAAKIAKFYETELDNKVNGLSKIIEPVVLIIIGATVGVVVGAVMMPIMNLSQLAGSF